MGVSSPCSVELGNVAPMMTWRQWTLALQITNTIIAKSDIFGVVLPSNISTGVCVRVAGDKNDKNEDTLLGGMRTTQATRLILFQRGQFGPASKLQV